MEVEGERLDPSLALIGRRVGGKLHEMTPEAARAEMHHLLRVMPGAGGLMDRIETIQVPGPAGEVEARLYTPADLRPEPPGLVFFHGGGWVIGDLDTHDGLCRLIAGQTPCKVLSVNYRLAPEHKFPAAVDDAVAAFRFAAENARELGFAPSRLAVGGDSAGGNLAAVVAQQCRRDAQPPCGQLMIYPVIDAGQNTASYELFSSGFGLSREAMRWFFDHYLNDPSEGRDPRVSPGQAEDLSGLPPAVIAVAGFDVLRDEGVRYAEQLEQAGVETRLLCFPLIHSFARLGGLPACRPAIDATISELAGLFHRYA